MFRVGLATASSRPGNSDASTRISLETKVRRAYLSAPYRRDRPDPAHQHRSGTGEDNGVQPSSSEPGADAVEPPSSTRRRMRRERALCAPDRPEAIFAKGSTAGQHLPGLRVRTLHGYAGQRRWHLGRPVERGAALSTRHLSAHPIRRKRALNGRKGQAGTSENVPRSRRGGVSLEASDPDHRGKTTRAEWVATCPQDVVAMGPPDPAYLPSRRSIGLQEQHDSRARVELPRDIHPAGISRAPAQTSRPPPGQNILRIPRRVRGIVDGHVQLPRASPACCRSDGFVRPPAPPCRTARNGCSTRRDSAAATAAGCARLRQDARLPG